MATCISFYNAVGNLDVYSMFYSFFYLWTVIGFVSNQLLCYHIGNSSHFLKSHILNKSFRQSSDQSSVVTKNQEILKFLFHQKAIHVWLYDSFGLELSFLGGKRHADAHKLIKHGLFKNKN